MLKKCEKQRNAEDMKKQATYREFNLMHLRLCMIPKKKKKKLQAMAPLEQIHRRNSPKKNLFMEQIGSWIPWKV